MRWKLVNSKWWKPIFSICISDFHSVNNNLVFFSLQKTSVRTCNVKALFEFISIILLQGKAKNLS